jgi:uncharacterized protein
VIVVIDTNVWISGMQFAKRRGNPTLALEKAMNEDVIASCSEIEDEILRVLTRKFFWERHGALAAIETIMVQGMRVQIQGAVMGCRDRNDDMFLKCAEVAGAKAIVAGDKDLLSMKSFRGVEIITPAEYLRGR